MSIIDIQRKIVKELVQSAPRNYGQSWVGLHDHMNLIGADKINLKYTFENKRGAFLYGLIRGEKLLRIVDRHRPNFKIINYRGVRYHLLIKPR